jgi:hypothetical protein
VDNLTEALKMDPFTLSPEARASIEQEMALQAKLLTDNPAFRKALDDIKLAILTGWQATQLNDTRAREEYHRRYLAVTSIEGILRDYLQTGIMHDMRVQEEQRNKSALDRLKRFWQVATHEQPTPEGIA